MLNFTHQIMMKSNFSQYLEKYYLNWQIENGRSSIRQFSRWLDINHALIDQWMNGKGGKPGPKNLAKLSLKIGPEVYDLLDLPRPPLYLQKIEAIYDDLSPEQKRELSDKISDLLSEYLESNK